MRSFFRSGAKRTLSYLPVGLEITVLVLFCLPIPLIWLASRNLTEDDKPGPVYTADEDRFLIPLDVPSNASEIYYWSGGSFGGSITYWAFTCSSVEDCWTALESRGLRREKFQPWKPSEYAVVMRGPGFYHAELQSPRWDVSRTKHGAFLENVRRSGPHHCEWMEFYAVDFDRCRVFYHYESGGFPCDEVADDQSASLP